MQARAGQRVLVVKMQFGFFSLHRGKFIQTSQHCILHYYLFIAMFVALLPHLRAVIKYYTYATTEAKSQNKLN